MTQWLYNLPVSRNSDMQLYITLIFVAIEVSSSPIRDVRVDGRSWPAALPRFGNHRDAGAPVDYRDRESPLENQADDDTDWEILDENDQPIASYDDIEWEAKKESWRKAYEGFTHDLEAHPREKEAHLVNQFMYDKDSLEL